MPDERVHKKPIGVLTQHGQFVPKSVLDGYAFKAGAESRAVIDEFAQIYEQHQLVAPLYNPLSLARHLELNTYHARAVYTKARDTAGLGWELLPIVEDPSEEQHDEIEHLLEASNEMPLQEVLYRFMVDIESTGYAVLEVARDNFDVEGPYTFIGHIPSHTIRVHKSMRKYAQVRTTKVVWFKRQGLDVDLDKDTGIEAPLGSLPPERRASELIFRAYYTPRSDFYGIPDHIPALGAISGDAARRDYNIAFFDNYGVPALLVFITGDYDPGEAPVDPVTGEEGPTPLEAAIQKHFAELSKNPYSTLVLTIPTIESGVPGTGHDVKIEVRPLAVDVKDASFRLFRQDNRDEVLSAHSVPRYRMGLAETGVLGGNFVEVSNDIYKASIIGPRQKVLEDIINLTILWDATGEEALFSDWRFALSPLDVADETKDLEHAEGLFKMGALTPNDLIRAFGEKFGISPSDHPAMDAHYINDEPIDLEVSVGPDVEAALQNLRSNLLGLAKKALENGHGGEVVDIAGQL